MQLWMRGEASESDNGWFLMKRRNMRKVLDTGRDRDLVIKPDHVHLDQRHRPGAHREAVHQNDGLWVLLLPYGDLGHRRWKGVWPPHLRLLHGLASCLPRPRSRLSVMLLLTPEFGLGPE
uniref:Uncharacterized protein n=1 Tax=Leersia perrieri TaxID=77586 RepID=A0A0D9WEB6_9ORYZ